MANVDDIALAQASTRAERLAETLMEEIRAGVIADGAPLPSERDLCARFDVSRPLVRAALMQLQLRGYASQEATRRPRACKPTVGRVFSAAGAGLRDVLGTVEATAHMDQMRQFIEVGAVRQAAQEASNLQLAQIHRALERCYAALQDDARFARADADFHRAIVAVVQNPILLELHDRFVFDMVASRPTAPERVEMNRQSYEEHRQIYEAIAASNPEAAMDIMDRHLSRAYRSRLSKPARLSPDSAE
ncbi:FCD domain-containing protein [Thalassovita sp.]|uniref:FCD domain-containing protein n=1 Tax=Thalassovita sp. TaxID=1979401 RepID=UPI002AB0E5DA|nr:FCD domain-containing protein [Thalassovita sp.]